MHSGSRAPDMRFGCCLHTTSGTGVTGNQRGDKERGDITTTLAMVAKDSEGLTVTSILVQP